MAVRIRSERAGARLSQEELAKALQISKATIQSWENGKTEIPAGAINAMCDLFGCTSDWLLGRSETRKLA